MIFETAFMTKESTLVPFFCAAKFKKVDFYILLNVKKGYVRYCFYKNYFKKNKS